MKIKRKGKVHPSPAASSSSPQPRDGDILSVLLPATIIALTTALTLEDRLVLSYMIRSPTTSDDLRKKGSEKHSGEPPLFDCDCFNCYTRYWYRWDSSPNRDIIHEVIEAFENHLTSGELSNNGGTARVRRRKEKPRRLVARKSKIVSGEECSLPKSVTEETTSSVFSAEEEMVELMTSSPEREVSEPVTPADRVVAECVDKGLARKMLPDVLGLLTSRLWNLWNPTVHR